MGMHFFASSDAAALRQRSRVYDYSLNSPCEKWLFSTEWKKEHAQYESAFACQFFVRLIVSNFSFPGMGYCGGNHCMLRGYKGHFDSCGYGSVVLTPKCRVHRRGKLLDFYNSEKALTMRWCVFLYFWLFWRCMSAHVKVMQLAMDTRETFIDISFSSHC